MRLFGIMLVIIYIEWRSGVLFLLRYFVFDGNGVLFFYFVWVVIDVVLSGFIDVDFHCLI